MVVNSTVGGPRVTALGFQIGHLCIRMLRVLWNVVHLIAREKPDSIDGKTYGSPRQNLLSPKAVSASLQPVKVDISRSFANRQQILLEV